jgi:hypothetical protein
MGGSPSVSYAAPIEWYDSGMRGTLGLGRDIVGYATQIQPEERTADIDELQRLAGREAAINAMRSRDLEREMSPEIAAAREELARQASSDLAGGPSRELSNLWLRQGLQDVIATGAQADSGFARSALADKTRRDYMATRQNLQDRAAAYLSANPQPIAGLDVGSLAGASQQAKAENIAAREQYRQQVLGFLGAQAGNVTNAFNQSAQMEAARRGQNAQAYNAASAASASGNSALMGAGLGAAGAIGGAALIAF